MDARTLYQSAPLFTPVLAFLAGIAAGNAHPALLLPGIILVGLSLPGYLRFRRRSHWGRYCLLGLAFGAGLIHYSRFNHILPPDHIARYLQQYPLEELAKVHLSATIVSPAIIHQPEKTFPYHTRPDLKTQFLVDADRLTVFGRSVPVTGRINVSMPGMRDGYQPGQRVQLSGRLVKIDPAQSALPFLKRSSYHRHNFIFARLFVSAPNDVEVTDVSPFTRPALTHRLQRWARNCLMGDGLPTGEYTRDLLDAVILGQNNSMENELNQAMTRIGAAHFLAVSGFHLLILSYGLWLLGTAVGLSRRQAALLVILCVILYAGIADFRPSITRAAIMTITVCVGVLLNRPAHTLNALALAAGLIVLINPNQLFLAGFQLSFLATLGLVVLARPIYLFLFVRQLSAAIPSPASDNSLRLTWRWIAQEGKLLLATTLAAAIAAAPLVMVHFNLFSLIGPLGSVLLYLPAVLLTFTGFLQLGTAFLCPVLHPLLTALTDLMSGLLAGLAMLLGKIPGSAFEVPSPAWPLVIASFFVLFSPALRRRKVPILLIATLYLSAWLFQGLSARPGIYVSGPGEAHTTVVNTGRGLAIIDCGGYTTGHTTGLTRILSCNLLAEPRLAILTAPDEHYFSDAWALAECHPQVEFALPAGFQSAAMHYEPVNQLIQDETLQKRFLTPGEAITLGHARFEMLYPPDSTGVTLPPSLSRAGAVLITLNGRRTLIASGLTGLDCRLIEVNYPHLRADTLILTDPPPAEDLEPLIEHARITQIVLHTPIRRSRYRKWETMAEKHACRLIAVRDSGGFLIDNP